MLSVLTARLSGPSHPARFAAFATGLATRVGSRPLGALEANVEGQHFQNGLIFKSTNHQFSFLLELSGVQRLILPHSTRIISPERTMETVETHGNTVKKCIDPAAQQPSRLHLSCWERSGNPMPMRGNMPSSMRCHDSPSEQTHRRICHMPCKAAAFT